MNSHERRTGEQKPERFHFKPDTQAPAQGWTRQRVGAVFALAGGMISILFATALTDLAWLAQGETAGYLRKFGTALFILAIPLLVFGAHCLDAASGRAARSKSAEGEPRRRGQPNIEPAFILSMLIGAPFLGGSTARTQAGQIFLSVPRVALAQTAAVSRRRQGGGSTATEKSGR